MNEPLPGLPENPKELTPLTVIRTETALSRFPVHRIAKKGNVRIELKHQASALLWRVSYNSEYGQPGPLAYKLDTLIVNRRIEAAKRPVPKLIRLGSLRDIAEEIGAGEKNTGSVKNALLQNASAFITAKISYQAADRSEKTLEAAFTRYSLVFTGESLPNGSYADAVYLVLNDVYMEVLNAAMLRPLDYDYMRDLPPAAQRFYEIVSYQIYAALHFQNERARLRYSEYCLLSTATRYPDFDHVKKQMYKIHHPHLEKGYLAKVSFEETTDADGQPDWWMYYVPGPNASNEYREFTGNVRKSGEKRQPKREEKKPEPLAFAFEENPVGQASDRAITIDETPSQDELALIGALAAAGLNRADAERLAREQPEECTRQLSYLPFVPEFKTSRGAYLRSAVEQGFGPPKEFIREQNAREEQQRKQTEAQNKKARLSAQEARRREEATRVDSDIVQLEKTAPQAYLAFAEYIAGERIKEEAKYATMPPAVQTRMRELFDGAEKRRELFREWRKTNPASSTVEEPSTAKPVTVPKTPRGSRIAKPSVAESTEVPEDPEAIRAIVRASLEEQ